MLVIGGAQKQSGGVDRSTRDNHNVPGVCLERAVTFHNDSIDFVASRIGFQTLYQGVGQQRDVGMLYCGIHAQNLSIRLGLHETWEAVARVATNAGTPP